MTLTMVLSIGLAALALVDALVKLGEDTHPARPFSCPMPRQH